jgi:hypothetical protein
VGCEDSLERSHFDSGELSAEASEGGGEYDEQTDDR